MCGFRFVLALFALALTVGTANADTFSIFDLSASTTLSTCTGPCPSFGPIDFSGQITVDQTTGSISAFSISPIPGGSTTTQGQSGVDYFLLFTGDPVGSLNIAFDDAGDLSTFIGGNLDQNESIAIVNQSACDETDPTCSIYTFSISGTLEPATTPLPAALPLFASGLAAFGLLGWRRKRKAQAAA
jgi:hypothetical protein